MNKEKISEALSYLDDDIIKETDALRKKSAKRHGNGIIDITRRPWFKMGITAAAIILILVGGGAVVANSKLFRKEDSFQKSAEITSSKMAMDSEEGMESSIGIDQNMLSRATDSPYPTQKETEDYGTQSLSEGNGDNNITADMNGECNLSYITTFCNVTVNGENISGTYGFDLSMEADYDVSTGDMWELEILNDDTWTKVKPREEKKWSTTSYSVGRFMGTRLSLDFNLDNYGYLKNGTYRIVKPIVIHRTVEGNKSDCENVVYCEFEIK